jgi:hypothetical protein
VAQSVYAKLLNKLEALDPYAAAAAQMERGADATARAEKRRKVRM